MKYIVSLNGKNYEVEVVDAQATVLNVSEQTVPAPTPVQAAAPTPTQAPAAQSVSVDGDTVKAPLPGTVVSIKVSAGQQVKSGSVLMIIEAMKMENEILAPRDGVVSQLLVNQGKAVETGTPLVALK